MNNREQTINIIKIVTNIILGLILLIAIITIILYHQEVNEAIMGEEPNRLMKLFEERTDTTCLCANPDYGYATYIPFKS